MHSAHIEVFDGAIWGGGDHREIVHSRTNAEAEAIFVRGMLDMPTEQDTRNPLKLVVSLILHVLVVGVVVLTPLLFTQVLDLRSFETVFLVAPRPPAAAPPPAREAVKTARPVLRPLTTTRLTAPAVIPQKVRIVANPAPPPEVGDGVQGGVPGGVPGGVLGGIIGGMGESASTIAPPPPAARKIVRVGGDVKPPVPISTPDPVYPAVAKAGHIEGLVVIDAVIDEQGNVVQAKAIAGPPLLVAAALQAVAKWKYAPTYLNGEAVAIRAHVQVTFRLQ